MKRIVQAELLDELPPADSRAIRSRRDLRRVNAWMRNPAIMADVLQGAVNGRAPGEIIELGAGDGHFLLQVAQRFAKSGRGAARSSVSQEPEGAAATRRVVLLDRQAIVAAQTLAGFKAAGWQAETVAADVFDWLSGAGDGEVIVANLFLHHFEDARLAELFRGLARRARLVVAIEPRRTPWTLFYCRWLWLIGCSAVTRHDAAISVQAGFIARELSSLWPARDGWQLTECDTSFFSHLFIAQKSS